MNIFISNINNLNEDIENFVIVKKKIEDYMIEQNIIEKKNNVQEYINQLSLQNNIFMMNNKENDLIPFKVFKTNINEICIVYCYQGNNKKIEEILLDNLKKIKYNLDSLTELSQIDIVNGKLGLDPYFIIDGNIKIKR